VKVSDKDTAAVRAVLAGDIDSFDGLQESASDSAYGDGFAALMAIAFVGAVRDRFSSGWTPADVIRFVGQVRVRNECYDLSPTTGEELLFAALRNTPLPRRIDEFEKGYAQVTLLVELVGDLDEQQLEEFLAKARAQADQWLAEGSSHESNSPAGQQHGDFT
jgi:hypothetical protein